MLKNIFEVDNKEKMRIISLHEIATKSQYLSEQNTEKYIDMTDPCNNPQNHGSIGYNVRKSYINNVSEFKNWMKTQNRETNNILSTAFTSIFNKELSFQIDYENEDCIKIGRYFCQHKDVFNSWNDFVKTHPTLKKLSY